MNKVQLYEVCDIAIVLLVNEIWNAEENGKEAGVEATLFFYFFSMALPDHSGAWPLIQFRNLFYTDGRTSRTRDQPVARPLSKHRTTQTQNKRTQISMSQMGFEPTIPAYTRAKTFHALDRAAEAKPYKR
jgi:hypothetical protein